MKVRVKAGQMGYYGMSRRREGSVFELTDEAHFSERWMEEVDAPAKAEAKAEESESQKSEPEVRRGRKPKAE